jgi:hypothetical protein
LLAKSRQIYSRFRQLAKDSSHTGRIMTAVFLDLN